MPTSTATLDIGALYATHAEWLQGWLRRRIHCPQRASDLTQDTFCRLLERADQLALATPRSYLTTVARRLLIDDARRRDVERAVLDAACAHGDSVEHLTPERVLEAVQLLDRVVRVMEALPKQARKAFYLRRIVGLEQSQIAARLGVSLSTVKRHIALANAECLALLYEG